MMKLDDWIARLKHLAINRDTYYANKFPANCGEIHGKGVLSFDCIGMVKSVINYPDIVYKTAPVGYYVKPNQVIPDTTEKGILNLCTDVSSSFKDITQGEYLYMSGHAGVYVGLFTNGKNQYNVIECTAAFGGGVVCSWIDLTSGKRYSRKGGYQSSKWEAHGKLSRYIDYTKQPHIVVDGNWGVNTTKFVQEFLGTVPDGIIADQPIGFKKYCTACSEKSWKFIDSYKGASNTIKALQKWCGMSLFKRDGRFGPETIKALQTKLGNLQVDGYCGEYTVKALQEFLNSVV